MSKRNLTSTSKAAANSIACKVGSIRSQIYALVKATGNEGCTCDEVETFLDLRHQTASARFTELRTMGLLVDSGKRRLTESGREAIVYVIRTIQSN